MIGGATSFLLNLINFNKYVLKKFLIWSTLRENGVLRMFKNGVLRFRRKTVVRLETFFYVGYSC